MATTFPNWTVALNKVRAGTANARILCVGDSTTFGSGSNGTIATGNVTGNSYTEQLISAFNSASVPAMSGCFGFTNNNVGGRNVNDPRFVYGTGWSNLSIASTSSFSVGGVFVNGVGNTAGNLSFTPIANVDTFNVYYLNSSTVTGGSFTMQINSGSTTAVNASLLSSRISMATISGILGTNTLNLKGTSGAGGCFITGIEAYNSAQKSIIIDNAGAGGAETINAAASWLQTGNAWNPGLVQPYAAINPDLVICFIGINDADHSVGAATYGANIAQMISNFQTTGATDVLLVSMAPGNPGGSYSSPSNVIQLTYVAAMFANANSTTVGTCDVFGLFQSFANGNANGWYTDDVHPSFTGYSQIKSLIFNTINISPPITTSLTGFELVAVKTNTMNFMVPTQQIVNLGVQGSSKLSGVELVDMKTTVHNFQASTNAIAGIPVTGSSNLTGNEQVLVRTTTQDFYTTTQQIANLG